MVGGAAPLVIDKGTDVSHPQVRMTDASGAYASAAFPGSGEATLPPCMRSTLERENSPPSGGGLFALRSDGRPATPRSRTAHSVTGAPLKNYAVRRS